MLGELNLVQIIQIGKFQFKILRDWRHFKEELLYLGIIFIFTLIAILLPLAQGKSASNLFYILLIILFILLCSYLIPVMNVEFNVEKNFWSIKHTIFKIPLRQHSGKISDISCIAIVHPQKKKKQSQKDSIFRFNSYRTNLELWGFEDVNEQREIFIAISHRAWSIAQNKRDLNLFLEMAGKIIEFLHQFNIPIDLKNDDHPDRVSS
jgi:hypothetical protein